MFGSHRLPYHQTSVCTQRRHPLLANIKNEGLRHFCTDFTFQRLNLRVNFIKDRSAACSFIIKMVSFKYWGQCRYKQYLWVTSSGFRGGGFHPWFCVKSVRADYVRLRVLTVSTKSYPSSVQTFCLHRAANQIKAGLKGECFQTMDGLRAAPKPATR